MPRRELKHPRQVEDWLVELSERITAPAAMILIGSGALLWHAAQRGITEPLPENSMDVDPITDSEEVARLCYEAVIGSEFERRHGWHVNLMPDLVLRESPPDWLVPKRKRNEPRDRAHEDWTRRVGLLD